MKLITTKEGGGWNWPSRWATCPRPARSWATAATPGAVVLWQDPNADGPGPRALGEGEDAGRVLTQMIFSLLTITSKYDSCPRYTTFSGIGSDE